MRQMSGPGRSVEQAALADSQTGEHGVFGPRQRQRKDFLTSGGDGGAPFVFPAAHRQEDDENRKLSRSLASGEHRLWAKHLLAIASAVSHKYAVKR